MSGARAGVAPAPLPRIAVSRRDAAVMLGISQDTVKDARDAGLLHPKAVSFRSDGRVSRELYSVDELRSWFEGLADA